MNKIFDCIGSGCAECTICDYLAYVEWAQSCAPGGSTIEYRPDLEAYLKARPVILKTIEDRTAAKYRPIVERAGEVLDVIWENEGSFTNTEEDLHQALLVLKALPDKENDHAA